MRLNQPFESGQKIPAASDREIHSGTQIDAERPVAHVVGTDTGLRINLPEAGYIEQIMGVGADVYRAILLAERRDGGLDAPVLNIE